jgi:hypothetical protein
VKTQRGAFSINIVTVIMGGVYGNFFFQMARLRYPAFHIRSGRKVIMCGVYGICSSLQSTNMIPKPFLFYDTCMAAFVDSKEGKGRHEHGRGYQYAFL